MAPEAAQTPADTSTLRRVLRRLLPYALHYRWRLLAVVLLSAVTAWGQKVLYLFIDPILAIIFPGTGAGSTKINAPGLEGLQGTADRLRKSFFDLVLGPAGGAEEMDALVRIFLIVLVLGLAIAFALYLYVSLGRNLGLRMIVDLRRDVCAHLLRLSMKYHGKRRMGDLLSRLTHDVGVTLRSVNIVFEDLLQHPFLILGSLGTAYYASPPLALAVLFLIPLVALPIALFSRRVRKGSYRSSEAQGFATSTMEQMLSGIRVVKSFQMEERELEGLDQANRNFIRKTMQMVRAKAATEGFLILLTSAGTALVMVGVGWLELRYQFFGSPGRASVFLFSVVSMYAHAKQLTRHWQAVMESAGSGARLLQILDLEPEVRTSKDATPIEEVKSGIEFRSLSFAYEKDLVLRGVDHTVKAGSRVAIVGPSGAGKSTLLDLVARFYDPVEGAILVDGRDLRTIRLESWLRQIAIVSQQPFLFNTTIRENIRYANPQASDEDVEAAARAARVDEFALRLPEAYDSVVGERGARLSGGELQRITIARAILRDASVLLLDEPTSFLDSASEQAVQAALDNLMKGKTTFVIAHRLSTVRNADEILVLERGRIVEKGTHAELLAKGGVYRRLHDIQFAATA